MAETTFHGLNVPVSRDLFVVSNIEFQISHGSTLLMFAVNSAHILELFEIVNC